MKLKLGDALALPAVEAVTQKYGFIGRSGSGKSYAAMKLAELFLGAGAQIIALDWVGIWWSLRLAANGKHPGFEHVYIFGGEHADVDLRPESGALMADLVVDKHISVVLDVMHFRKAERTRFATAFAEQFFHRKKTARTACHLFIEEAQAYLPQMVRGEEARMVGVFEDIGKVGRNYGIGNSLISQRPQAINKDVLNQIEVLLAFQTNGPQERKAIAGWTAENTDAGAAMMQELPKLRVGDALVWSPQWLRIAEQVHIEKRDTYDASSTPTQQAKAIRPKTLAKADLEQLGEEIQATIEKAKADDPNELRKQITELKRQVAQSASQPKPTNEQIRQPKTVEKFILKDGQLARAEKLIGRVTALVERLSAVVPALDATGRAIGAAIVRTRQATASQPVASATPARRAMPPAPSMRASRAPSAPSDPGSHEGSLPPGEHATLTAALQYPDGLDKKRLGILTGYKRSSRDAYIARLAQKGLVETRGAFLYPTDAGRSALNGSFQALPTGADLVEYWRARLPEGERKTLEILLAALGGDVERESIDQGTGYKRSSRDAYLTRLKARGLVDFSARGMVRASAELFE